MASRRAPRLSAAAAKVPEEVNDEADFLEIHAVMLYVEEARRRTERAIATLRESEADDHLIVALERTEEELRDVARRLRQGTFFAVPKAQLSF
jgi:Fic family protein